MSRLRSVIVVTLIACFALIYQPAGAQALSHTVQPGETLFRIALRYGVTVEQLVAVNHLVDPSHILVGETLLIPGSAAPVNQNPVSANPAPINTAPVYYVVQPGDTLNRIAQSYGISTASLVAANGLPDINHIEVGQALVIPGVNAPGSGATVPQAPAHAAPNPNPATLPAIIVAPSPVPATAKPPTAVPPTGLPPTVVPPSAAPSSVAPIASVPTTPLRTHIVAAGEGLAKIARDYNVTWPEIAALNNVTDPNTIYAGMVLKIPNPDLNPPTTMETSQGVPPGPLGGDATTSKTIVVVLHEQRTYAYENGVLVRNVLVSTGLPDTPTVTGTYHIYVKYSAQLMTGPGYYLPGVPWVMYFYEGYSFHGTYWHHNWGHPMSHGCVNMPTEEALWLYNWAPVGTTVTVIW